MSTKLLTLWADDEIVRLRGGLAIAERKRRLKPGRLHPATRPIWVNALLVKFFFDPKRRAKTGLVRTLLALNSFAKDGVCFPKISSIAKRAGLDKSGVKRHLRTLRAIGVIADIEPRSKPGRRAGTEVPTSNVYTLWNGEGELDEEVDTRLIDLVFAAATGEGAIFALALRELRINDHGVGAARLDRAKIDRALEEGVRDADKNLVLDRTLTGETIVTHFDALRSEGLLLKVGHARVTIKPALGNQTIVNGRLWYRDDKGKPKPRRVAKGKLSRSSAPTSAKGSSAPTPQELNRSSTPTPGIFLEVPPPELLGSELHERGASGSFQSTANYDSPSGSGLQPSPPAGGSLPPSSSVSRADVPTEFRILNWARREREKRAELGKLVEGFGGFTDALAHRQRLGSQAATTDRSTQANHGSRSDDDETRRPV